MPCTFFDKHEFYDSFNQFNPPSSLNQDKVEVSKLHCQFKHAALKSRLSTLLTLMTFNIFDC